MELLAQHDPELQQDLRRVVGSPIGLHRSTLPLRPCSADDDLYHLLSSYASQHPTRVLSLILILSLTLSLSLSLILTRNLVLSLLLVLILSR